MQAILNGREQRGRGEKGGNCKKEAGQKGRESGESILLEGGSV